MSNAILELDQFIRSIEINKDHSFSFFLGAGASISSGIPSAYDCTWHWKQKLYTSQTGNNLGNIDFKSDNVKSFIQKWLDSEGVYPPLGDPDEYSVYIEKCYPIEDDRRAYFKSICEKKEPSIGYHLLALLHEIGLIQSIWTTNFDDLSAHAVTLNKGTIIDITLDTIDRIIRPFSISEILQIKLHGDYKYGPLKNTSAELQKQDETFRQKLIDYLNDKHLIVFGYSGRNDSIMEALIESYTKKGSGRLYWGGYSRDIPPKVQLLINTAKANGRTAFYVPTDGFDKAMISLIGACTKGDESASKKFADRLQKANIEEVRTPFSMSVPKISNLDKDTAFAGIGYSVTKKTDSTDIVLGCSHIYNSKGQGLKYRLSKVEDQLIWDRLDRPHLSYKDSYSFGMSIIDLFYTTMNSLPRRVVIHKRNYFMADEIKGLKESLIGSGIKELDLIEINFDDDIKFVAGTITQTGQPDIKSYPIDRGTCILLNGYEALLWTHGVVPSVQNPNFNYYLGGRYIPGPLKIIKHFGPTNIGTIANEILGLTKVNWNSFDMYTQLPATVNSSHEIARIGRLLSKREGSTYDYRYFI